MRRLIILGVLIITAANLAIAQRYKDVFPSIASAKSNEEALSIIKSYMLEDLDHPNSNFRLALIYEDRYKDSHPLTEFERTLANSEASKIRFLKAQVLVDDKEVKRNSGWYREFASSIDSKGRAVVEFSTIQNKIKNGYDSANLYVEKLPAIYEAFTESVDFYDQCIKLFAEINGQYASYDKLALLYDEELKEKLETLKSDYDSSLFYLDKFIKLNNEFPVLDYNPSYSISKINTYRLEGLLTSPNFLVPNIEIWGYKTWANNVQLTVADKVSPMRKELVEAEEKLQESLTKIKNFNYDETFEPHIIDKKLEFDLRRFDNQSLPVSLLKYKEFKQTLLLNNNKLEKLDSTDSKDIQNAYFGELLYATLDADSLLKITESRIDDESINKYPAYLTSYYGGKPELNSYLADQKSLSTEYREKSVNGLRVNVLGELNAENDEPEDYRYGRLRIPSKIEDLNIDSLDNNFHTLYKLHSADGSKYLGGIVKSSRSPNPVLTFVIKVDENGTVKWYNQYELIEEPVGNQFNILGSMVLTPEGCALSIFSYDDNEPFNSLIYLNENGEEIFNNKLQTKNFPEVSKYVEDNSSILVVYKGDSEKNDLSKKESVEMISYNLIGDLLWNRTLEYAGDIQSLITLDNGYMIVGNFSSIKNVKGLEIVTRINNGQTNAFAALFDRQGRVLSVRTIKSPDQYVINKVAKINDSIINLMGYKEPSGATIHFIINGENQVIYSNL